MALSQQRQALSARSSSASSSSRPLLPAVRPRRALVAPVRALAQLPQGVSAPKRLPQAPEPRFGFVYAAERLNSRACMIGFIGTMLVEALAHRGVLDMVGFQIGNGLGFEL
ncbi:hypothetical protein Rsub_10846 [Raphidocelis subcapitata]|uniref:High light inducible protein n=1 Tax=Raphidocelis subcapitata TaxID=307507 RepID=A0A2V0PJM2_9CHLO|nr:hypothetical protein Rsub_10846 [Raphidocelis subcapitata]|eukprot:GBF98100.1 hypothetical protein Rsub_10846 [Raphidocelis subcapitata]